MNIQEGNKLIAEFMGNIRVIDYATNLITYWGPDGFEHESGDYLQYHTSWDWLMPVVEKIEQDNYGVKQCRKVVEIYYDDTKEVILRTKEKSRIESLYKAVVGFIQWYNTQQH